MIPNQEIVFLGFHLSSVAMTICLPQEKSKNQTESNSPTSQALSVNTAFGHLCGNNHSNQTSYFCGSIISSSTSSTDKQCGFPGSINRNCKTGLSSGNSFIRGGEDRAGMVDSRSSHPQSITSEITSINYQT